MYERTSDIGDVSNRVPPSRASTVGSNPQAQTAVALALYRWR